MTVASDFNDLSGSYARPTDEYGIQKVTMIAAHYTSSHGSSNEQCSKCIHFRAPSYCTRVIGMVNANGWCSYFFAPPSGYYKEAEQQKGEY